MKKKTIGKVVIAAVGATVVLGVTTPLGAGAASLVTGAQIKDGTITHKDISSSLWTFEQEGHAGYGQALRNKSALAGKANTADVYTKSQANAATQNALGDYATKSDAADAKKAGSDAQTYAEDLSQNVKALPTLKGAVYRIENYKNGGGGSATVACADDDAESQKYVAIAGGVQGGSVDSQSKDGFAVQSSFPGRMNWDTNQPKDGRLDGWIVLGNAQHTSTLKVWALCVPNDQIKVQQIDLDN